MIELECPHCGKRYEADIDTDPGREFWCQGTDGAIMHAPYRMQGKDRVQDD